MLQQPRGQRKAPSERLGSEPFDLVVVGGGIIGTGVAWIAARAGLRVALCERDDLAAWTSSASSKLIHGGLRYLRMGDVKLVREAHTERRALARVVAPHLVRPLRFVMPLRADGPYGPVVIGAGMVAYGALSGFRDGPTLVVAPTRAHALAPALRTDGLRAGGVYHDHQTDDARLVVAVARAAAACGATIATRCEVVGLDVRDGRTTGVDVRTRDGRGGHDPHARRRQRDRPLGRHAAPARGRAGGHEHPALEGRPPRARD